MSTPSHDALSESIQAWLQQLDAICEAHAFETAEQASAWLEEMSRDCSIEEFFDAHAPSSSHLIALLSTAESQESPEAAIPLYQRAVRVGERFLAAHILQPQSTTLDPQEKTNTLPLFVAALAGLAACQEWLIQPDAAAENYRKILHLDPEDSCGAFDKLFCLLITQGLLAEARSHLKSCPRSNAFSLYNAALLAILEAADTDAIYIAASGQMAAEDAPDHSRLLHQQAAQALDQALRANRYLPHILTHPRGMEAATAAPPLPSTPAEALAIAQTSAHLWLGDWAALDYLIRHAPRFPLSHGGHDAAWAELLEAMGGDISAAERLAYVTALADEGR